MKGVDLTSLHCLVTVAREGSIAAAARRLGLAVSAVSTRVSALEDALGTTLLDRTTTGARLTPEGQTVLRRAERILELTHLLAEDLAPHEAGLVGEFRLAIVAAAMSGRLAEDLSAFIRENPAISVSVFEGTNREAGRAVAQGSADVGVLVDHNLPPGLSRTPYARDPIWVIAQKGHPLFAGREADDPLRFDEVIGHDLVALTGAASVESLAAMAADAGQEAFHKTIEVSRHDSLRRLVEAGLGIGLLRESGVKRYLPVLAIEGRPLAETWAARRLCVAVREGAILSRAASRFAEHLRANAETH
ncbi:MAG: LysR substrate-binding domain-containing protein [Pseudomonadota bacterium]